MQCRNFANSLLNNLASKFYAAELHQHETTGNVKVPAGDAQRGCPQ